MKETGRQSFSVGLQNPSRIPVGGVARRLFSITYLSFLATTPSPCEMVVAGNGSGFFVTKDGYFITNEHVVDGADGIQVKWGDKLLPARVLKTDAQNDIAVLKLEGEFTCVPLGGDLETRAGEDVFTIGFPMADLLGQAPKTTLGSVTALSGIGDDARAFQISVQIQPGNSGGPLVLKSTGNVIGVTSSSLNTAMLIAQGKPVPQNVNYAMKASYIRPLLATIPGLAAKLPAAHAEPRPWATVQEEVESSTGLVMILKEQQGGGPPAPITEVPDDLPPPAERKVWVFADSSQRRLTRTDLESLNADMLWRARNEIYARNGLIFSSARGRAFAASLGSAYEGTDSNQDRVSARLNAVEKANVELIKSFE